MTFAEAFVDADGFRVRYLSAGEGPPLVHIHSAGGLKISRAHELLAERFRVIALEIPGFGDQANARAETYLDVGSTIVTALREIGLERFHLWGTSFGGAVALGTAAAAPESIEALVLESPGAILPEVFPEVNSREDLHQLLYAHPEQHPLAPALDPTALEQRRSLVERLQRATREEVEKQLADVSVRTLVVFGALDRLTPPELGPIYRDVMPNCEYILIDDAAHDIAADQPEELATLVARFIGA